MAIDLLVLYRLIKTYQAYTTHAPDFEADAGPCLLFFLYGHRPFRSSRVRGGEREGLYGDILCGQPDEHERGRPDGPRPVRVELHKRQFRDRHAGESVHTDRLADVVANGFVEKLYYAKNIKGGADTATVTLSGSTHLEVFVYEYSGLDTASPLDISATPHTGTSVTGTSGSLATANANDLLFALFHPTTT